MALALLARSLASIAKPGALGAAATQLSKLGYATEAASRKDVVNLLDNSSDPEVSAAIKAYQAAVFKSGKVDASKQEEALPLAAKVERKYVAAQVVESGLQTITVPLTSSSSPASVKRYAADLLNLGGKAGFEEPFSEVQKGIAAQAQTAETVKELLGRIKNLMSPEFYASLSDALNAVEAETNSAVVCDGSSAGYKKFAEKVKSIATANKIPHQLLLDAKKHGGDEEAAAKTRRDFQAYLQAARVADAKAELDSLQAEAVSLMDKHLGKTAEQVRKEQEAALASLQRKIENAKGAKWAAEFQADLKSLSWFDSQVAANPAVGPRASA